jgi:hypothetical protein
MAVGGATAWYLIQTINPAQLVAAQHRPEGIEPMFLLAQDPLPNVDWGDLLFRQGPLAVVFLLVCFGVLWYAPKFFAAHFAFIEHSKETQAKLAASYEKLADTQCDQTELTNRMTTEIQEQRKLQERVVGMAESFRCRHP